MTQYSEETIASAIALSQQGLSSREIAAVLNVRSKSTINNWLANSELVEQLQPEVGGEHLSRHSDPKQLEGKRFFITSVQNNTYLHNEFWKTLTLAAKELDATIVCIPFSYNVNAFSNGNKGDSDLWYDPRVEPYLVRERMKITDSLYVHAELNISPTAANPLSGLQNYVMQHSAIIPHTKQQLKSLPTHPDLEARVMYTTGAVTLLNYKQQKVGQIAEFKHVFGACYVEVDDDGYAHVRQINAETDTGNFQDLTTYWTPHGKTERAVAAINLPDLHLENADDQLFSSTLDLLTELMPSRVYLHDTIDFAVRNHHNISDPLWRFNNYHHGNESVEKSMEIASDMMQQIATIVPEVYVVRSNHDLALEKWLNTACYRSDPENAAYFLKLQSYRYDCIKETGFTPNMLEYVFKTVEPDTKNVTFLKEDENHVYLGIQFGSHGHNGANGSRGSTQSFKQTGLKVNKGHSHQLEIDDGVYSAGVLTRGVYGYCKGYSSWSCGFIITYPNGKRTIVRMNNNLKYKA